MVDAARREALRLVLPAAGPGTQREVLAWRYGRAGARPKAYVQAAVHADEIPAMLVATHLTEQLETVELAGELIVVPAANPVGLAQRLHLAHSGRYSFETGINFNRGYPDLVEDVARRIEGQLGSDPDANVARVRAAVLAAHAQRPARGESGVLKHWLFTLAADADIVLDLHCDLEAPCYLYMGTDAWPGGRDLAAHLGAAATLLARDSGGQSFDETHANLWWRLAARFPGHPLPAACLAATVELRGQTDVDDALAARDAAGLVAFLTGRGVLRGAPPAVPELLRDASPLTAVDIVYAPWAGIVVYHRAVGEEVCSGDPVADLLDPMSGRRETLRAGTDGLLLGRLRSRYAAAGEGVFKVAGAQPLRGRAEGDLLEDR